MRYLLIGLLLSGCKPKTGSIPLPEPVTDWNCGFSSNACSTSTDYQSTLCCSDSNRDYCYIYVDEAEPKGNIDFIDSSLCSEGGNTEGIPLCSEVADQFNEAYCPEEI